LQKEASNLTLALKAPQVRGSWGEHTLRRVVEMAGLVEYCDFGLQETVSTEEGRLRPDLIVRMPGERVIVVDAKNIFQKYYEAMGCEDEVKRNSLQNENVKNLRKHIKDLSSKGYWEQYGQSADFVVFFMPNENIFVEALRRDEDLFEDAIRQRILLTHPISLIGLLKIVAHSWSQMKLAENTEKIKDLGRELYERMSKFVEYFAKMGTNLSRTVESYNSAVGAFEGRVLPSARKFSELGIAAKIEIEMLEQVEKTPRTVQSSDLKGLSGRKNIELP
jgi:DNA recombination protein RmuC